MPLVRRKPHSAYALRVPHYLEINTGDDTICLGKGDWLIVEGSRISGITHTDFVEMFDELEELQNGEIYQEAGDTAGSGSYTNSGDSGDY